jgi:hypothetical protein
MAHFQVIPEKKCTKLSGLRQGMPRSSSRWMRCRASGCPENTASVNASSAAIASWTCPFDACTLDFFPEGAVPDGGTLETVAGRNSI